LVEGKRAYWVGVMRYSPTACRILITEKDRDGELLPYDPKTGNGPWWHDTNQDRHYWNGEYCLEFMFEDVIPLSDLTELRFVTHHPRRCSIDPNSCPDRGHSSWHGAARFLTGACNRNLLANQPGLWVTDEGAVRESLTFAWEEIRSRLGSGIESWSGPIQAAAPNAGAFARAAMSTICERRNDDRKHLFSMFDSLDSAVEACAVLIESDLGLEAGTLPRQDD